MYPSASLAMTKISAAATLPKRSPAAGQSNSERRQRCGAFDAVSGVLPSPSAASDVVTAGGAADTSLDVYARDNSVLQIHMVLTRVARVKFARNRKPISSRRWRQLVHITEFQRRQDRNAIAQGRPGSSPLPLYDLVCTLFRSNRTRDQRVQRAPGLSLRSDREPRRSQQSSGFDASRECEPAFWLISEIKRGQSTPALRLRGRSYAFVLDLASDVRRSSPT